MQFMRRYIVYVIVLMLVFSLSACEKAEKKESKSESRKEEQQDSSKVPDKGNNKGENLSPSPTKDMGIFNETLYWSDEIFKPYTTNVAEPEFTYVIKDIIDNQMAMETKVSIGETRAWRQTLLDMGYEPVLDAEYYWSVKGFEHLVFVNGTTAAMDGTICFYISAGE